MMVWTRILAALLAAAFAANGAAMLVASLAWYDAVPGVVATGPFNPHFVKDIGAAYLVGGLGCAWYAWRPREGWPALVAAAAFQTLHAAIHLYDATCGARPLADLQRDFVGVHLLTALTLLAAYAGRPAHD